MPMRITLTVEAGPHRGQSFAFEGHDLFLVGRSKKAHFRLRDKDKYFSRLHFMVEVNPPLCRVMDVGSRNGTFVNGEHVDTALLSHGDRIKAGHTVLRVAVSGGGEEFQPAPAEPRSVGWEAAAEEGTATCPVPAPGTVATGVFSVPGYRLVRELGRGGMGTVHLARREADGAAVAIKTVVPARLRDRRDVDRFLREAEIVRHLDHPNVVRFLEVGETEGVFFFVMEYVPGADVQHLVGRRGRLKTTTAVRLMSRVLKGLVHAHAGGFVHRDLKPANILVGARGGDARPVKLADFGLARVYLASRVSGLTLHGDLGGTPHFMAPEQVTDYRNVSPAADQYGAAAVLYYLLTGQFVYDLPPMPQALLAILEREPVPIRERIPDVPARLASVVHRALAKDPAARFAHVEEFRQALKPFVR